MTPKGTPSEIVKCLRDQTEVELAYFGGGKKIAAELREHLNTLESLGWTCKEDRSGNNTVFTLAGPKQQGGDVQ